MPNIDHNPEDGWIITEARNAGRILSKGEVTVTNSAFSLPNNTPYSLFLYPINGNTDTWFIISVQLEQDLTFSDLPYNIGCWTESAIIKANITPTMLANFRVFYGCGQAI